MLYRSILFYVFIFILLASTTVKADSEFNFRDGQKIEIQWYEKEGEILDQHVCFNYKEDERKFRQCRKEAVQYFEDECEFYSQKFKSTSQKYRQMYEPEMNKFCNASQRYEP